MVDGDGIIGETKDAVEAAERKGETWLLGSFAEILSFNCEVANTQNIVGDEAGDFT